MKIGGGTATRKAKASPPESKPGDDKDTDGGPGGQGSLF